MNNPEQQQIDHWIKVSLDDIAKTEDDINNGFYEREGISIQSVHTGTALIHASLARAKFLNGDPIDAVRTEFAQAARYVLKNFTLAYDESDPDYLGERRESSCLSEGEFIAGINYALMAADLSLAAELAGWFRDPPPGAGMRAEINAYAWALKHLMANDTALAEALMAKQLESYAKRPSKKRDARQNYHTLSTALLGIARRDQDLFNQGLQMQVEFYRAIARGEYRNTDQGFICDHAVALANLGIHHGLRVAVEYDTLPHGLLIEG